MSLENKRKLQCVGVITEAKAAEDAGVNVVMVVRPGNMELTEEEEAHYSVVTSFCQLEVTGRA